MKKSLTRTGNSVALVLDKPLLEQLGLEAGGEVELSTNGDVLIVTPIRTQSREKRFRRSAEKVVAQYSGLFERLAK